MNENSIKCPKCGCLYESDCCYDHVTYYGDETHNLHCSDCGADFQVEEVVIRVYDYPEAGHDAQPEHRESES